MSQRPTKHQELMAAIGALSEQFQSALAELTEQLKSLEQQNAELQTRIAQLESRLLALEAARIEPPCPEPSSPEPSPSSSLRTRLTSKLPPTSGITVRMSAIRQQSVTTIRAARDYTGRLLNSPSGGAALFACGVALIHGSIPYAVAASLLLAIAVALEHRLPARLHDVLSAPA